MQLGLAVFLFGLSQENLYRAGNDFNGIDIVLYIATIFNILLASNVI